MLLALTQWLAQDVRAFNVFQYITLRAVLATLTALAISLLAGPLVIRKLTAYKIGQAVRNDGPQSHLAKAGTPTVGGAVQSLRVGRARGHIRLRRHRLGRRLPQGREEQSQGTLAEGEILLAVVDWPCRGDLSRLRRIGPEHGEGLGVFPGLGRERIHHEPAAERRPDRALFQERRIPARRVRIHHAQLFRDRRNLERGQSDRRAGRACDHAGGDGRGRPRGIRDGPGAGGLFPLSALSLHPRGSRAHGLLRRTGWRGPGFPLVQRVSR